MDATLALAGRVVLVMEPSRANDAALAWAADWAAARDLGLTIVATHGPFASPYRGSDIHKKLLDAARDQASSWLDKARDETRAQHPTLSLMTALLNRPAWEALIEVSDQAGMTVVGTDSLGGFMSSLPSGATDRVVSDAHGPVAFVPPQQCGAPTGPITVGVDLAGSSQAATRVAFAMAAQSGLTVRAVCAVGTGRLRDGAVGQDDLHAAVTAALEPFTLMFPMVRVSIELEEGLPEQTLLRLTQDASMLVVGSRGIGGWRGLLIGSVSRRLVGRSRVPVLVVRSPHSAPTTTNAPTRSE